MRQTQEYGIVIPERLVVEKREQVLQVVIDTAIRIGVTEAFNRYIQHPRLRSTSNR